MAETLAKYSFLPWVRQGLGNEIIEADTFGNAPGNGAIERPDVLVKTKVKASKGETVKTESVNRTVKIQGPGDVLGLNQKTIIRVHPKNGVTNFETNNLCYVEFYEEDLPWRFTPAKAVGNKLRPWLALIVLRNDEFERNSTGGTPTPFISIDNTKLGKVFGNEKDTFALAHVHVLEDLGSGNEATDLKNKLDENPDLALSRVICPRKLEFEEGNNEYHAFLIPAFETGRLAGMGEDPSSTKAQKPSWTKAAINNGTNPVSYPYYFSWKFQVSDGGDFESLAEKLTARELPENIGKREIDLKNMGFGIEPTGDNTLSFVEGSMRHEDYVTAPWPISGTQLKVQLKKVLNISADLQDELPVFSGNPYFYSPALDVDPIISPPTYGKWHRGTHKLTTNGTDWVHDINLHPTHRAAAGLGTRVVQQHQEEFMEIAWEQIGQINEANQKIIESELAKRVANSLVKRKINRMSELDVIATTGRTLDVLKISSQSTAKKALKSSLIPTALRSGSFVKVANKITPKALFSFDKKDGVSKILNGEFLDRLNIESGVTTGGKTKISAAPTRSEPKIILPVATALNAINLVVNNPVKSFMENLADAINTVGLNFTLNLVLAQLPAEFIPEEITRATEILNGVKSKTAGTGDINIVVTVNKTAFESRINTSFDEGIYGAVKFVKEIQAADPLIFDQGVVLQNRIDFQTSFEGLFINPANNNLVALNFSRPVKAILPIDFRATILEKLNPLLNFQRRLQAWFTKNLENNNKPIMAYPRFPIPMYDYLKDISADYIIPNISEIEPDTITIMEPNKKFIEAFLTGMNHEFSRELLWREFPTDMRGSYFRHFWEYNNNPSAEKTDSETVEEYTDRIINLQNNAADITELHKWKNKSLGENHVGGPSLVLLIKGDLLRKYPGTLVYAQRAKFKTGNKNAARELTDYTIEENVKWPIITGNIEPDVYFFGFELTKEEANGNRPGDPGTDDPGWFFVLRERPGQISFGLDDLGNDNLDTTPGNWDSVTWENITGNANQQPGFLKVDGVNIALGANPTDPKDAIWGANSSDMAYILYQSPILFARHASTMLNE